MKKSDVINAILRESIIEFAEHGFQGSSLRSIAQKANTALSAIDTYFGTKKELYLAAENSVFDELASERNALLRKISDANKGKPTSVFDLINCLALPFVQRAVSRDLFSVSQLHLVTGRLNEHASNGALIVNVLHFVKPWIEELSRTCPTLSKFDCAWAFSYCMGVLYAFQVIDPQYEVAFGPVAHRSAEDISAEMSTFCSGGIDALVVSRSSSGRKS